ncbi:MAG: Gfo/Idh/MocA family oxidoreductase [Bryobacteraceae bacterium]|jgi:predicted dehydrogenase
MKFLIVGLGSMGKRRLRNLQYLKAGEIVGYDPREDRRAEASDKYGIITFSNFEQALNTGPDALIISTPPDRHCDYALVAAKNDKHFFTEASVVDDGMDDLIAVCRGKSIVAAPSCTMRFHPSVRLIRDLIQDRAIGPILTYTYHCGQYLPDWHPWEDYRSYYVAKRQTGGCREIVPFELSWLVWAVGEVEAVSCFKGKLTSLEIDIDDVYQILLRHRQGTLGHLLVDVVARVPYRVGRFLGERGVIEWNWTDHRVRVFDASSGRWTEYEEPKGTVEEGYIAAEDMYRDEMRAFVAAIRGEQPWGYTLTEDKNILSLLQTAERSSDRALHLDFAEVGAATVERN